MSPSDSSSDMVLGLTDEFGVDIVIDHKRSFCLKPYKNETEVAQNVLCP